MEREGRLDSISQTYARRRTSVSRTHLFSPGMWVNVRRDAMIRVPLDSANVGPIWLKELNPLTRDWTSSNLRYLREVNARGEKGLAGMGGEGRVAGARRDEVLIKDGVRRRDEIQWLCWRVEDFCELFASCGDAIVNGSGERFRLLLRIWKMDNSAHFKMLARSCLPQLDSLYLKRTTFCVKISSLVMFSSIGKIPNQGGTIPPLSPTLYPFKTSYLSQIKPVQFEFENQNAKSSAQKNSMWMISGTIKC
ncbi:hypothetical protein G5I_02653 [Acromyrmex echinatior]|uniref:Uncharacterized protein n=1 Tax=Acromyrmex echinatior TaxID=103372 RepID=F4WAW0_ACREC|nr:hypothetical protein G5I_02653 [Acromyrmex echinatior]